MLVLQMKKFIHHNRHLNICLQTETGDWGMVSQAWSGILLMCNVSVCQWTWQCSETCCVWSCPDSPSTSTTFRKLPTEKLEVQTSTSLKQKHLGCECNLFTSNSHPHLIALRQLRAPVDQRVHYAVVPHHVRHLPAGAHRAEDLGLGFLWGFRGAVPSCPRHLGETGRVSGARNEKSHIITHNWVKQ